MYKIVFNTGLSSHLILFPVMSYYLTPFREVLLPSSGFTIYFQTSLFVVRLKRNDDGIDRHNCAILVASYFRRQGAICNQLRSYEY